MLKKTLILASSSPRRKELLEELQIPIVISSSNVDESFEPSLSPEEIVMYLARKKWKLSIPMTKKHLYLVPIR